MSYLVLILVRAARLLIRAAQILLVIRAVLSWFPDAYRWYQVLTQLTEPIVAPVRMLLNKLGIQSNLPIDLSILCTFLLLYLLQAIL